MFSICPLQCRKTAAQTAASSEFTPLYTVTGKTNDLKLQKGKPHGFYFYCFSADRGYEEGNEKKGKIS